MATLPFPCTATPLSANGVAKATAALGIDPPTLWAMMTVETPGCGYLSDQRPQILYERHIFSRLTKGQWDATHPGISNPVSGGYGPGGASQYARLAEAVALDEDAALQSASWGLGQVLGQNYPLAGTANAAAMVQAMCASEDAQLAAVVGFIKGNHLAGALQSQNWAAYAKGYNGADYAKNNYDGKLKTYYTMYSSGNRVPDLTVRAAQIYLTFLGFAPQGVDGQLGANTLLALHKFQAAHQIPLTAGIDDGVLQTLAAAMPAPTNLLLA